MIAFFKRGVHWAFAIFSAVLIFPSEASFNCIHWVTKEQIAKAKLLHNLEAEDINIFISRLFLFIILWFIASTIIAWYRANRQSVTIKGTGFEIKVEYGNILEAENCKRVINFDECFTTTVGTKPGDIKSTSICGQYLNAHTDIDIGKLVADSGIKILRSKSKFKSKDRYEVGSIVPNGNDLLMAFARLDESGRGLFYSKDEYLNCLSKLWDEIDKYYCQMDVSVPILGSGITRFEGGMELSQQELLDLMIGSYKLSSHKIKQPHKLRIICRKRDDFSLNQINA